MMKQAEIQRRYHARHPEVRVRQNALLYQRRMKDKPKELARLRAYKKTKRGYLTNVYCGMRTRCEGRSVSSPQYAGIYCLPRDIFISWAMQDAEYTALHTAWEGSGYSRAASPSIDRIDPKGGYELANMQWLTLSENSIKGNKQRARSTKE